MADGGRGENSTRMSGSLFASLRADLALVTLDHHLAFQRLTDATPRLLEALERVERIGKTEADPETAVVLMLAAVEAIHHA